MTRLLHTAAEPTEGPSYEDPAVAAEFQSRARREGGEFDAIALDRRTAAGATGVKGQHHRHHYPVDAEILTPNGGRFLTRRDREPEAGPGAAIPDKLLNSGSADRRSVFRRLPSAIVLRRSGLPRAATCCAREDVAGW
jgi:hypothetical protein